LTLRRATLTIVAFAGTLGGCRSAAVRPDDSAGPVQVLSVTPTYRSDGGASFAVLIAVANHETQPGRATRVSWRIWLQRRWFAQGEQVLAQPIAAGGATRFELVLPLALRRPPAPADLVPVELSFRGDLTRVIGGSEETLPFARTLTVSAPNIRFSGAEDE
jgi:hypothetical protein